MTSSTSAARSFWKKIVNDVKNANFFAIMADETTDISTKEQLSMMLRYPTSTGIQEKFVGFIEVTDTTGQGLADKIWDEVIALGLDPMNMRGQGYDGAANMSGWRRGVQAVIMAKNPLALYTHCSSHVLNLVIVKSCSIPEFRNMFGVVQRAAVYFGESAKRMAYLDAALTATSTGDRPAHQRLKKHCQTRWIEQADALGVFQELYGAVLEALGTMATDCDSNTSSAALQLTTLITGFPFLIALTTAATLLEYTKPLSVILQRSGLDMCTAMGEVRAVQHVLADIRQNVDERFAAAYRSAAELGSKSGTEPTIPRLCGRQTQRTNIPAADPETYYRLGIYIPFLDHLMEGLSDRFGAAQQEMAEKIISLCNDENVRDLATSVVMTLTDSYLDTGRTLSTDNFYTSVPLAEMLLTHKTHLVST